MSVFGFSLVHVFLHLFSIRRDIPYLSEFSPIAGKRKSLTQCVMNYNSGQNVWSKVNNSGEIEQDQKALIHAFTLFFHCYCQNIISGKETGYKAIFTPKFENFLTFPNFLRPKFYFGNSQGNSHSKFFI